MSNFKRELIEFLTTNIPGKVVSGEKEFLCNCPLCGKPNHFYIKLPSDESPVVYDCKKCNESGLLTRNILKALGVESIDGDIISNLNERHKNLNGNYIRGSNKNKAIYKFPITNTYITLNENTEFKLKYINDRLGLKLSYQDILDCKIVLNLLDIYKYNNLQFTRDKRIVKELDESFIGFLGYNNAVLNMRNLRVGQVSKYIDKRYVNYNLLSTDTISGTSKYYIIPTVIDTLNPEPVKIHIAEGPIDVLSIFYNLYNGNKYNSIYATIEGRSYINLIKFLLADLKIINAEIHIYFDNDVSNKDISEILSKLQYLYLDIYFHWNRYIVSKSVDGKKIIYEKDFGVPKNKIVNYYQQVIKST